MQIPTTLKHKPVIVAGDYERTDGRYAYHSDAKGLSLGLAQWNDRGRVDISAKVRSGPASQRSSPSTGFWIWLSWPAGPGSISERRATAIRKGTTRITPVSTGWACRETL